MASVGDLITHIRVVNHNPFVIEDRYDGVRYIFPPMEKVTIPVDVATHIFGYRKDASEEEMFKHCQRRFGWNTLEMQQTEQDHMYFDALDIKPAIFQLVEVPLEDAGHARIPGPTIDHEPREPLRQVRRRGRPSKRKAYAKADDMPEVEPAAPAQSE